MEMKENWTTSNNLTRLPKIDLSTFTEAYEEWRNFFDIFNSLIHFNTSLTDIQRFHYLKSALKGEAIQVISSIEISEANYADAWSRLQERYDNERITQRIQTHIKAIFDLRQKKKT